MVVAEELLLTFGHDWQFWTVGSCHRVKQSLRDRFKSARKDQKNDLSESALRPLGWCHADNCLAAEVDSM
jgi:hypothetical protein